MKNNFQLTYKTLLVRFSLERTLSLDFWIGAILRNYFLVNAGKVNANDGLSLYERINTLSLSSDHPYYKQFVGGFPKGILIDCRDLTKYNELIAGATYSFSVVLIGSCIAYDHLVEQAIRLMFNEGIGHPNVSASKVDITGLDDANEVSFDKFILHPNAPSQATVSIKFETPLCLIRATDKKESTISYQDKLNGFPSFYQFMRSVVSRVNTLGMLYGDGPFTDDIEPFLQLATKAQLLKASVEYHKIRSTPKKGRNSLYVMDGYIGEIEWVNVPTIYLPLLAFSTSLSIGYNVQYGLGAYSIAIK